MLDQLDPVLSTTEEINYDPYRTLHIALQELEAKGTTPDTVNFLILYGIIEKEREKYLTTKG